MDCSFVIPAHDEEDWIEGTLAAIDESATSLGLDFEMIVVADACQDRTVEHARAAGARVVEIDARQIAASRNAGGRSAIGETLFFVDADTVINADAVRLGLEALEKGAAGGGSTVLFDGEIPRFMRAVANMVITGLRWLRFAGGCFLFCRRATFDAVGGFDESLFVTEEISFASALKKHGRFVVVRGRVLTSARKIRSHPLRDFVCLFGLTIRRGKSAYRKREGLELWYGERRRDPGQAMSSPPTTADRGHSASELNRDA